MLILLFACDKIICLGSYQTLQQAQPTRLVDLTCFGASKFSTLLEFRQLNNENVIVCVAAIWQSFLNFKAIRISTVQPSTNQ